jgi:hypothetical protein
MWQTISYMQLLIYTFNLSILCAKDTHNGTI